MKLPIILSCTLLGISLLVALVQLNLEFLFYILSLVVLIGVLVFLDKKFSFSSLGLWGFALWLLLHVLGGFIQISGSALYATILIPLVGEPYYILKYDQVVHFWCYFVFALLTFDVLKNYFAKKHRVALIATTIFVATGIGALNEFIEFFAVVFFTETGVGDYYNTGLDIVANFLGACVAVLFLKK